MKMGKEVTVLTFLLSPGRVTHLRLFIFLLLLFKYGGGVFFGFASFVGFVNLLVVLIC